MKRKHDNLYLNENNKKYLGTITDGDIRKYLTKHKNLNSNINKIYNILNKNGKLIIEVPNAFHDLNTHPYYIFFHMHITIFCYENTSRFTSTI